MVPYPTTPNFAKHTENLHAVAVALTQVERAHKRAIRDGNGPEEFALRKVHTLMLGIYAEARLRKIIDDPIGFNERERRLIWQKSRQDERWIAAVDFAVRRHYGVLIHQDLDERLTSQAFARVETIKNLLAGDLSPLHYRP